MTSETFPAPSSILPHRPPFLFVDAITAMGVWSIPTDELGIDVLVTGSQKALMLPAGMGFISVSDKAWKAMEKSKMPKFYFDLRRERDNQKKNQKKLKMKGNWKRNRITAEARIMRLSPRAVLSAP